MINKIKVSQDFFLYEFQCSCCDCVKLHPKLLILLQKIRCYFQKPIIINSGYRCPKHNKEVGGSKTSYHLKGQAVDWYVKGIKPEKLLEIAEYCGATGLGLYMGHHFCHIDIGKKRSWTKEI